MKLSLNWVKQYTPVNLPVDELVAKIGAQLGEIDSVENIGAMYHGAVIVKVVECVDHPNADRLHVCTIDDGGITPDVKRDENGLVQVVCGAPNVKAGVTVVWLPPGVTVPDSHDKEPFVLEARELRGVISNGMLASPKELAFGDSHEGLLILDDDKQPGTAFAEAYDLNDIIIDIENKMFTHRPDLFGELGLAREIAGITNEQFNSPDWYKQPHLARLETTSLPLKVTNELPQLVPRFMAVAFTGVKIAPSPLWLQSALVRVGIRPINNAVDITNYLMFLTGQPLHAFDYDKVKAFSDEIPTLVVRNPRVSEKLALLNGKTIDPRQEAIMIATDKQLIGVGGVMGGAETEIDDSTSNIILECANFDMYSVRRTAMAHGLFTDAVTRFNKGQSPLQNPAVLAEAMRMISEITGAKQASEVIDDNHVEGREWVHPPVPMSLEFVNSRLGLELDMSYVRSLLEHVEFKVEQDGDAKFTLTAPFWRTDIETREDVVEEVGRLHGYDKLPLDLPQHSIKPVAKNGLLELKQRVREALVRAGANELLTYSFVHGDLLYKVGQDKAHAFGLGNALSPDLQYYRLSLTPSLLDKVHPNIKAGFDKFAIFEIGKAHNLQQIDEDDMPSEFEMLDVVYAANDKASEPGAAFYQARALLESVAEKFGTSLEYRPIAAEEDYDVVKPYDHTRSAKIFVEGTDIALGMIGEYKASVRRAMKLPVSSAGFGIGLVQLQSAVLPSNTTYRTLARFPSVRQDLTLKVSGDMPFADLFKFVDVELGANAPDDTHIELQPVSIYQAKDDTDHKNLTFRVIITAHARTLTEQEVTTVVQAIAAAAHEKFGAERI